MPPPAVGLPQLLLPLPAGPSHPYHAHIFDGIRDAILRGLLAPGARLPSTRQLAPRLGVARSTVVLAYRNLAAEGYVTGTHGSGSFVSRALPDSPAAATRPAKRAVSDRAEHYSAAELGVTTSRRSPVPFRVGEPAVDAFPVHIWRRLYHRRWRVTPRALMRYGDPAGFRPLRQEIVDHLGAARGVHATLDQVILVRGTQQALDLAVRVLVDPGNQVWLEDPGYLSTRAVLTAAGARVVPVPVDGDGLVVHEGERRAPNARMAFVSPSHQYPLGVTMSLARRLELLAWARRVGAWVLEDDFDSELRYTHAPHLALQGLDSDARVIYVGTFSKTLFPALRLGYLVVPRDLTRAFLKARTLSDYLSPTVEQAVVADFLGEGHFARHLQRMRTLYAARQEALVLAAERELAGLLRIDRGATGLHVVGWLRDGVSDRAAFEAAQGVGIETPPLSRYCLEATPPPGLLFGYSAITERTIAAAVRRLRPALQDVTARARPAPTPSAALRRAAR
ncbi:MAG TPA: PLP-dependent aminotransferase family protein [Gemmatimonadaceae bacterium]|nr:PLP-dependent aminotransferase family protein [Gemmatimonadaceae bacterium]